MQQRTALVTGGSSGIGRELARLFARDGYHVVLVARDPERLAGAQRELIGQTGAQVATVARDLAQPDAVEQLERELARQGVEVDALVNNAGFGTWGPFAQTDLAEELALLQVNVVALTHLTKVYLREMVKRGSGRILNVASTAAFQPGPLMAVYYASKAYVLSFSEALAEEVAGTGVTVTALCPGPTWTNFQARAGIGNIRLVSRRVMTSEAVARAGYAGMLRGQRVVIPGWHNQLVRLGVKFAPTTLTLRAVRWAQQRRFANDE